MSAIITDQLRILNAKNFVAAATTSTDSYYVFIGLPNATQYDSNWDNNPPDPKDNFDEENDYWDTIVALKKIKSEDVKQVVRKVTWQSGITYDMYRHKVSRDNLSLPSQSTNLYSANYYVVNSEYKVYICIHNGSNPENPNGRPSLDEPTFVDLEPRSAGTSGDGYLWKYLYTISPSDIIKFDGINFIPVPKDWGSDSSTSLIKENAESSGQIKNVIIRSRGNNLGSPGIYSNVPIKGDGTGAEATIIINNNNQIESITISNGGSGYTYASVDIKSSDIDTTGATSPQFEVVIPPSKGHGYDIYRELGAYNVLVYSRIENDLENPDFILGNQVARFGIVKNPLAYDSDELLTGDKVSAVKAIKLSGNFQDASYPADSIITQTVSTGTTAVGRVVSYDQNTGVLKYWQDRTLYGFNFDGTDNLTPSYGLESVEFTSSPIGSGNLSIVNSSSNDSLDIDTSFGSVSSPASSLTINNKTYYLGQEFQNGLSNPEVKKHSGDILYVDNRPSITRSQNQKEDIKVILQF